MSFSTKFIQTKPQVKNLNISFYDLYHFVFKNTDEKEIVCENENDKFSLNFDDFIFPNHYNGRRNDIEILK